MSYKFEVVTDYKVLILDEDGSPCGSWELGRGLGYGFHSPPPKPGEFERNNALALRCAVHLVAHHAAKRGRVVDLGDRVVTEDSVGHLLLEMFCEGKAQ